MGRNGRGCRGLPDGVKPVLGLDTGHPHRLLVARSADHDLHLVQILAAQTVMLQPHLVQGTGRGADVLADAALCLIWGELGVHVART